MKRKTLTDPNGEKIETVYLRFFGYRIWLQSTGKRQFLKNCFALGRITKLAGKAKNQLLEIQKLVNAINDDFQI